MHRSAYNEVKKKMRGKKVIAGFGEISIKIIIQKNFCHKFAKFYIVIIKKTVFLKGPGLTD